MSRPPFTMFTPDQIAQLARAAFRPPSPMAAPTHPAAPPPAAAPTPGFNLKDLLPLAELGLAAWKPDTKDASGKPMIFNPPEPSPEERRTAQLGLLGNVLVGLGAGVAQSGLGGIAPGLAFAAGLDAERQKLLEQQRQAALQAAKRADQQPAAAGGLAPPSTQMVPTPVPAGTAGRVVTPPRSYRPVLSAVMPSMLGDDGSWRVP